MMPVLLEQMALYQGQWWNLLHIYIYIYSPASADKSEVKTMIYIIYCLLKKITYANNAQHVFVYFAGTC